MDKIEMTLLRIIRTIWAFVAVATFIIGCTGRPFSFVFTVITAAAFAMVQGCINQAKEDRI